MKTHVLFPAVILCLIFAALSCSSKKTQSVTAQQALIEEPFVITYSEGGGFTGLVELYNVKSTGEVQCFRRMPGESDSLMWAKEVSANTLADLQRSLTMSAILNDSLNTRGNMTSILTYTTPDTSYMLSWEGVGVTSQLSPELKKWLAQLKSILKQN